MILRGEKLIEDARTGETQPVNLFARAAMAAFHLLFRLNSPRWGWQMVGTARMRRD